MRQRLQDQHVVSPLLPGLWSSYRHGHGASASAACALASVWASVSVWPSSETFRYEPVCEAHRAVPVGHGGQRRSIQSLSTERHHRRQWSAPPLRVATVDLGACGHTQRDPTSCCADCPVPGQKKHHGSILRRCAPCPSEWNSRTNRIRWRGRCWITGDAQPGPASHLVLL